MEPVPSISQLRNQRAVAVDQVISAPDVLLEATLTVPLGARGIIALFHASSAGRFARANRFAGEVLEQAGFGTLQVDLLTPEEEAAFPFENQGERDVSLLVTRMLATIEWLRNQPDLGRLALGLHASAIETEAALIAARRSPSVVAVFSRGGAANFVDEALEQLATPTLIVEREGLARAEELAAEFFSRHCS